MRSWRKPGLLWAVLIFVPLTFVLILATYSNESSWHRRVKPRPFPSNRIPIWLVFTRAKQNPLKGKLRSLLGSLVARTSSPLTLHLVTDAASRDSAREVVANFQNSSLLSVVYHDIHALTNPLEDIINVMRDHFSSTPGAYYSSNLFYLSIGLHKVSPRDQTHALMLDVDTVVKTDIVELFAEFNRFGPQAVVGIAPELTPVYHHILYTYRSRHKDAKLGSPFSQGRADRHFKAYKQEMLNPGSRRKGDLDEGFSITCVLVYSPDKNSRETVYFIGAPGGFPGVNSGVLLLHLARMRKSPLYQKMLTKVALAELTEKYTFKGHLGDQDFYTLLGLDNETRPLLHLLDCGWNRQLCDWWRHHGYASTFDLFSACPSLTKIYHGNCNSRIPGND